MSGLHLAHNTAMKKLFYYLSGLSILILFAIGFRSVQVARYCVNSPVVSNIFLVKDNSTKISLPKCQLSEISKFWKPLLISEDLTQVYRRVSLLGRLSLLGLNELSGSQKLNIILDSGSSYKLKFYDNNLLMDLSSISTTGLLERSIIQYWINLNYLNDSEPEFNLNRNNENLEILSIILWGYVNDQIKLSHKQNINEIYLGNNLNIYSFLQSENDYCHSPWVWTSDWEKCLNNLYTKKLNTKLIIGKPLTAYVANNIWNHYLSIDLKEKIKFWKSIEIKLKSKRFSFKSNMKYYYSSLKKIEKAADDVETSFLAEINFDKKNYKSLNNKLNILLSSDPKLDKELNLIKNNFLEKGFVNSAFINHENRISFVGTSAFEIELNNLKPNVQVHLVCKKFNKTRISKFTSDHVLVLDICSFNEVEKINWGPLMAVNLERFVALNPQVPFLSLHIPSLKKTNLWPNEVKINTFGLNGLSKKLGWQSQEWVSRLGAYRPHGVLNAVLLYRL